MKIGELEFHPIDLEKHQDVCLKFREDSFVVSFGSSASFYGVDGEGAERYLEWLKQRMSEIPGSCVHVWRGKRIVGQIEMRKLRDDAQTGYVNLFYLIPEYRGKGLGSRLDEYAAMFFKRLGCKAARLSVSPTNSAAMKFYIKHGWKDLGVREDRTDVHLMEKQYVG